jgi:hypothetical protein
VAVASRRGAARWLCAGALWFAAAASGDSTVVFNEIMYHPATAEATMEWVELYSQMAVDVDLSGWSIQGGIQYTFPPGAVIQGGSYLVVALSPATLAAATGLTNVLGPFTGRLANDGELLELRDNCQRLMDSVSYEDGDEWPTAADGGGPSLAKRQPNSASARPENWTWSAQVGGTPGAENFPPGAASGPATTLLSLTGQWRYEDSGGEPPADWREAAYDDGGWKVGNGLLYTGDGALPGPKQTALAPGKTAYYFRARFDYAGGLNAPRLNLRCVVQSGAAFYLNGAEVWRWNLPTGVLTASTRALSSVGTVELLGPSALPTEHLVVGPNVLAVEVHEGPASQTNPGLKITPATGCAITWDGNDGDYYDPDPGAAAPDNLALAAHGTTAFGSSEYNGGGIHLISNVNDGRYGNSHSWLADFPGGDPNPYIGLRFSGPVAVAAIAWSRDNGDTPGDCCGGQLTDRWQGTYTLQFTRVSNPGVSTAETGNPATGWASLGTVQYLSAQAGFSPWLRHRFEVDAGGSPLTLTGLRVKVSDPNLCIDELEVYSQASAAPGDVAFGAALEVAGELPALAFNEIAASGDTAFWLEIINHGSTPAELLGVTVVRRGSGSPAYTFPAQTLLPGGIVPLTETQLGFRAADGDRLFLYASGRSTVLDAATVKTRVRGRHPDGGGAWLYPVQATPGASNLVARRDEIVFNELMYHYPPHDPSPAVTSNSTLVALGGQWRYSDTGANLGTAWRAPDYNDRAWPSGAALLAFNAGLLPAPTNTVLAAGGNTYYFRTSFPFSGAASNAVLQLGAVVDDGAIFYLNGSEVHRVNMPAGPVSYATSAASPVGDAAYVGPITVAASDLVQGVNVLAAEVHQATSAATSSGIALNGGGLALVEEGPPGGAVPMNLARQPGVTPFVIDSLAGYPIHDFTHLNDGVYGNANSWIGNSGNPGYAGLCFGGLFTIQSIAFGRDNLGAYDDRTFGLYTLQYTRVASPGPATAFTGNADTGWATIGTLDYQRAGTGLFANPSRRHRFTFTPVAATGIRLLVPGTGMGNGTCIDELEVNPPDTSGDIVFGAELTLVTTLAPAAPFTKSNEEWVEFYNRSADTVDLSGWELSGGIHYRFPDGVAVPPGGYLVVANQAAALQAKWPEVAASIIGDFSGRMRANETLSLKDQFGNPVNTVRVWAGGWSDGGGSSLELTDPRADNRSPGAWADSDESARSAWQTVAYRMVAGQSFGSSFWNEFRLALLDRGEALVDDVSVIQEPDGRRQELIQNGGFETTTGNTHWRALGDHGQSQIITAPDNPANHVLKVSASAPPRTSHNHVETSFVGNTPLVDGQPYEVSFRARWLAGSPQLWTSGYMARLARTTILHTPSRHGTPGTVNSRRVANAGPTFAELKHSPVIPQAGEAVTVSVRASDPDGVASATLNYRVNPQTAFTSRPMSLQPEGAWAASVPGQAAGSIVQFYVTAWDAQGASASAPAGGPASRALYQVADGQGTRLPTHELRLIQLDADRDFVLHPTNVMSQALIGGTLIYDRAEVFYDVGVRLHGSAAGRARDGDDYICYTIAFPPGRLFRGVQTEVNLDRSGRTPAARQQDEIYVLHMFHRAGIPCHYSDLCYFIAPKTLHTGTAILQMSVYSGLFVQEQYPADGAVFSYDLTYEPSTTVDGTFEGLKLPVPLQPHLGTDFTDLSDDKEQYRASFDLRHGTREDDFSGLIRLCQTMALPQPQFDARIGGALDVDEALRIAALTILCGIGDIYYSGGLPHNLRVFTPADGAPAHFLPWDMDFVFSAAPSSSVYPGANYNFYKLLNHPATQRLYLAHVNDLCQTVFSAAYMKPWLASYGRVVGQDYSGGSSYIENRRAFALRQLPARVAFAITTAGGQPFMVNTPATVIEGTAWIDIRRIALAGMTNALSLAWTTPTSWQTTVPLVLGANQFEFLAYDFNGMLLASNHLTITSTAAGGAPDADGDGLPDAWELAHGLNPDFADATADADGDGVSNLAEYLSGTDPRNPASLLKIEAIASSQQGAWLRFTAVAGRSYTVQSCGSLSWPAWTKLADVPAAAGDREVELTDAPAGAPRFYRLVTPQLP